MCAYLRRFLRCACYALLCLPAAANCQSLQDNNSSGATKPSAQTNDRFQAWRQQQERLNAFAKYLNLSADQKLKFIQIQLEAGKSVHAARRDDSLGEEQMQQKIKQIHAQQREKILALLTPDQQGLLKKWNEEQKQKQAQTNSRDSNQGKSAQSTPADDDFFAGMVQDPDPSTTPGRAQAAKGPRE